MPNYTAFSATLLSIMQISLHKIGKLGLMAFDADIDCTQFSWSTSLLSASNWQQLDTSTVTWLEPADLAGQQGWAPCSFILVLLLGSSGQVLDLGNTNFMVLSSRRSFCPNLFNLKAWSSLHSFHRVIFTIVFLKLKLLFI